MSEYNPRKGDEEKITRRYSHREPRQLRRGRGRVRNMVLEPECRSVAIPGCARHSVKKGRSSTEFLRNKVVPRKLTPLEHSRGVFYFEIEE